MINRLYDAFIKRQQSEEVKKVLEELLQYTKYHFSEEEIYFRRFNFKETLAHVKEHQEFIKRVQDFKEQAKEDAGRYVFSLITFLQEWLINHITHSDRKYIDCFKSNNVF